MPPVRPRRGPAGTAPGTTDASSTGSSSSRAACRDLIIRGGENIYPIEIENRLVEHDGIADVCVVGVDHHQLGQEVAAVVVLHPGVELDADDVRSWVADTLAAYKVPAHVVFRSELPYTLTGKVLEHQVEDEISTELGAGAP